MNNFFTPDIDRGTYERIVNSLAANANPPMSKDQFLASYKVMPGVLKMAVLLDTGKSSYTLSPRKGVDPAIPTANLLDQNDFFAVSGVGLRIGRAAYASGIYSNYGNYPLFTYPDPSFFSGTGTSAGSEAGSLQTLAAGTFSLAVNNDSVVDPIPNLELMYNPESRYVASPLQYPQFAGNGDSSKGIFSLTPQVILDASADNGFTITVGAGLKGNIDGAISTGTTDSGIRNLLYVIAYGWKIKNFGNAGAPAKLCM